VRADFQVKVETVEGLRFHTSDEYPSAHVRVFHSQNWSRFQAFLLNRKSCAS